MPTYSKLAASRQDCNAGGSGGAGPAPGALQGVGLIKAYGCYACWAALCQRLTHYDDISLLWKNSKAYGIMGWAQHVPANGWTRSYQQVDSVIQMGEQNYTNWITQSHRWVDRITCMGEQNDTSLR